MEFKYFDAHTHAHFPAYGDEADLIVRRARESRVGLVTVGTSFSTSSKAVLFAEKYDNVWAAIGLYPGHTVESTIDEDEYDGVSDDKMAPAEDFNYDSFLELAKSKKVVAVGECGLDVLYGETEEKIEKQKKEFIKQIEFANKIEKPLMIHCRGMYMEVVKLLDFYKTKKNPIIHSFRGTIEEANALVALGCYFTFGGVITFPPRKDGVVYSEVIKKIPNNKILSETDAPWVAPVPYRGKRNEPAYVIEIVKKIAEIKNTTFEETSVQILENTKKVFGI